MLSGAHFLPVGNYCVLVDVCCLLCVDGGLLFDVCVVFTVCLLRYNYLLHIVNLVYMIVCVL